MQIAEFGTDTASAQLWVREVPTKPASAPASLRSGTVTRAWFDNTQPTAVQQPPFAAVDTCLHGLGVGVALVRFAAVEESDLPVAADVGFADATLAQRAVAANGLMALKALAVSVFDDRVGGTALQRVAIGADAEVIDRVVVEVFGLKPLRASLARLNAAPRPR